MSHARIAAAVVGLILSANPGTPALDAEQSTFRAGVSIVRVPTRVTDDGRPVVGLTADDFVLYDNGVRQTIDAATTLQSISMLLALDTSAGLAQRPMERLISAADAAVAALQPSDRVSWLTFSDTVSLHARQGDIDSVRRSLARTTSTPRAQTALWDAILVGASTIVESAGLPLMMIFTDGYDNASWIDSKRLAERLGSTDVITDLIVMPSSRELGSAFWADGSVTHRDEWVGLAKATGGVVFDAMSKDLSARLARRVEELRVGYLLVYTAKGVRTDGWHNIKVELKQRKGKVQARSTYFAG